MDLRLVLTGQTREHLVEWQETGFLIHQEAREAWQALVLRADAAGFGLRIVSSFRAYDRQLLIWNEKARGTRNLSDDHGRLLDPGHLTAHDLVHAILRWSALPGSSRHHWGTDLDVYDAQAMPEGYDVQLSPAEADGIFGPLHRWLDEALPGSGFFRPFSKDWGGIAPERWHLSYEPVATQYYEAFSLNLLEEITRGSQMALKETVLAQLPEIYERYVRRITAAY